MRVLSTDSALTRGFFLGPWHVKPQEGCIESDGHQRHLGPRQMDLLLFLAQHPDQVVSKTSLFQTVWQDVAVEDGALARCISELRRLLGDDARNPTFIATLPRRGYRLVAPVNTLDVEVSVASSASETSSEVDPVHPGSKLRATLSPLPSAQEPPSWRWKATYSMTSILLAALLMASFRHQPPVTSPITATPDAPTEHLRSVPGIESELGPKKVVVLGFENLSDRLEDNWLRSALGELLTAELAASSSLHVLPRSTVVENEQKYLDANAPQTLSRASRRQLQESLGSEWVVFGTYLSSGRDDGPLRIDVWIESLDGDSPQVVITETSQGHDILPLIQSVGTRLRQELRLEDPALPRNSPATLPLVHHFEGTHLDGTGDQCPEPQRPRPS